MFCLFLGPKLFMQSLLAIPIDPMSTSIQELIVEHTSVLPGKESDLCSSSRPYMRQQTKAISHMAPIEKETMGGSKYVKKAAKSQMNGATDDNGGH